MKHAICALTLVVGCGGDVEPKSSSEGPSVNNSSNSTAAQLFDACELDPNSDDPAEATCGQADTADRSCIVEGVCETGACGRLQGSDPFCTTRCSDDSECSDGTCVQFVFMSGARYCAPDSE